MRFDFLTLFPDFIESPLRQGVVGRAFERGLLEYHTHQIRDFAKDRYGSVDDMPYGGGSGMIMSAEPLADCLESVPRLNHSLVILTTPSGRPFNQKLARELCDYKQLILISGRYEGVDERFIESKVDCEISLGDFILSGGEICALAIADAVARLVPGVLGNEESLKEESFEGGSLEYPHYTRPAEWRGLSVPPVLLSGNHAEIEKWRQKASFERTKNRRPDLLDPRS